METNPTESDYSPSFYVHAKLYGERKLDLVLKWQNHMMLDILCILLLDRTSKDSVTIFLNPLEREYVSPLNFTPENSNCVIKVYGLSMKETTNGRFYQLSGFCKRKIKAEEVRLSLDVCLIFDLKETLVTKLPVKEKEEGSDTLDVTILRCPPASYTVATSNTFNDPVSFVIFLKQVRNLFVFVLHTTELSFTLPLELETGTWIEVQVLCASQLDNNINKYMIARTISYTSETFKTYLSTEDYKQLFTLAVAYINNKESTVTGSKMKPIEYFYRNKSEEYYREIMDCSNGVMAPYAKDFNGDQGSLINGALHGLFYSTYLGSGSKPPPVSFYGPVRLHLKANVIFVDSCNVYFSDFYCHYEQHYVTVVLTPLGSLEDTFCQNYLLQIDKYDNPFLKLVKNKDGTNCVMANMALVVEVFYTESVNISNHFKQGNGYMATCGVMGRGESKKHGIPKNENCKMCNLSFWR